jgi:hypothetical protein
VSIENMPDERLVLFYEQVRQEVDADQKHRQHFVSGPTVRQYADKLRDEMVKRRLQHSPIEWPS